MWGVEWGVILAMIIVNSVFAAYEIALVSVSITRFQTLVHEKRPGAKAALEMKGRHLFQSRYKSIVREEEVYLLERVRYIHLNPLRARWSRAWGGIG